MPIVTQIKKPRDSQNSLGSAPAQACQHVNEQLGFQRKSARCAQHMPIHPPGSSCRLP